MDSASVSSASASTSTSPAASRHGSFSSSGSSSTGGGGMTDDSSNSHGPPAEGTAYTPKNVLVTGGAGFIASHVVLLLVKKYPQYKIVNLDRLDYCSCIENVAELQRFRNYRFIKGNILSSDLVKFVLEEECIDTILHFAAQTHVDNSFGNSFSFTQNNILGTHVLLESAKKAGIKRFIHVSTDEVYGEGAADQEPMFEDQVLEPTNPYAATKAGAEFIAKSYSRSFGLPVIITRGNNVFGPHQYPEKLVPKFINLLMRGRRVTLHGNGLNTRNFLYVTDVANAFDVILHNGVAGKVYNIGGSTEKANIEVAKDLIRLMGKGGEEGKYLTFVEDRAFNDSRYTVNSEALKELGWKERVSWEEGLKATVDWYMLYNGRYGDIESALVPHPSSRPHGECAAGSEEHAAHW